MPWREKTVEKLHEEFVKAARQGDKKFKYLCQEYDISRKTGYKWLARYENEESMANRSSKPHQSPGRTPEAIERAIVSARYEHPGWGAAKLHDIVSAMGISAPSVRTINNILKRNGCINKEESLKHKGYIRFERGSCNELWQSDFKGDFPLQDGSRCFPLTILDDHSRYAIRVEAKLRIEGVKDSFEAAFREYGMPKEVLTDNGGCFAGFKSGYTQFERWLMDHDILPIHGRVMHPQTQGKIERFHRSMKDELLKWEEFKTLDDIGNALKAWRHEYNHKRPHEALGMKKPADVYIRSTQEYEEKVPTYEYSGIWHMCKVNNWGYLRYMDFRIFLSETFADTYLEVRSTEEGVLQVCYRNFVIADIDAENGRIMKRTARRQ